MRLKIAYRTKGGEGSKSRLHSFGTAKTYEIFAISAFKSGMAPALDATSAAT